MGLTDCMKLHYEEVLQGTYYEKYPELPKDSGIGFHYDIVNESDSSYAKLLDNIKTESTILTIKSDDDIEFKTTGYIATQDGMFWQIQGVLTKYKQENTK